MGLFLKKIFVPRGLPLTLIEQGDPGDPCRNLDSPSASFCRGVLTWYGA
jgi:hypothetical protein